MAQERGAWRRDPQLERLNPDAFGEEYSGDQHSRGPWRRDLRTDRQDDFGSAHQDHVGEKLKKEFIANSNVPQEDVVREPSFNRSAMPFPQGELWTSRSAVEAKDRQVMAYNKALELVGISHMPSETAIPEEMVIRDDAQASEKSDFVPVINKVAMPDVCVTTSEAPRELLMVKSEGAGENISNVEGTSSIQVVDSSHRESFVETNDKVRDVECNASKEAETFQDTDKMGQDLGRGSEIVENTRIVEKVKTVGEADAREMLGQHAISGVLLLGKQDIGNALEEYDQNKDAEVCKILVMNGDMNAVKGPTSALAESPMERSQESFVPEKEELELDIGPTSGHEIRGDETPGELNAATDLEPVPDLGVFEKAAVILGNVVEQPKEDVFEKPEVIIDPGCNEAVAKPKESLQSALEADVIEKMSTQSVNELEETDVSKISSSGDAEKVCISVEAELHATAAKAVPAEICVPHANSAPLLAHIPQGQQNASTGHPGSGPGILPSPLEVQQHISTGQPKSAPGVLPLLPPQGHYQSPTDQPFAQSYPVHYPTSGGDVPRGTQFNSYRMPMNRPVTTPQPYDQAARPMSKFNSGPTGYPTTGGWGQQSFQPRAPTQEALPVHGLPSYGTSSRQSHGPSTSGAPFYGAPNQGDKFPQHHGAPYPADQFSQHYRAPNTGDQYSQLQRPPNAGGFGHTNPGGYGPANSGGLGPTNPGGYGPPNPGGPFLQHHVSSNPGAPFSHQQVAPNPAGPFSQHPPPQSYRPSSHGPVFPSAPLSQNYGQSNQLAYGATFPAQPNNQNPPVSSQQPGQPNQFLNPSGNHPFAQPQLAPAQQGFISNTSFLPEQSQSLGPFAGVAANQVMQPSVLNAGFSSNSAFPTPLPGQSPAPWNFQASQRASMPPTGQPPAYSYPLTTIPPLPGLVQAPQAVQNDQYDPLSDGTGSGLGGAPKVALVKPPPDGGASSDAGRAHTENIGQDLDTGKASIPKAETDNKVATEDVGVVENISPENWSPGQPTDDLETGKDQALSKKSSRGLKMLRAAIADHVKEVLKPTWKEGYMSKEAFKTIAKKAVEKVVGNLPSHHIPKSQEKVDQYMKTSRPKISKLVQGYVDKYLKL